MNRDDWRKSQYSSENGGNCVEITIIEASK